MSRRVQRDDWWLVPLEDGARPASRILGAHVPAEPPPSAADRAALRVGDHVGLVFARETLAESDLGRYERLWVEVTGCDDPAALTGELDNQPTFIRGLAYGTPVTFTPEHVFAIRRARRPR